MAVVDPSMTTFAANIPLSSITSIVVFVIEVLDNFVGAVIVILAGLLSIIYDCEFRPVAPKIASSPDTVIVPDHVILLIIHVTGVAYGATVSEPDHVQAPSVALVVFGVSTIFETSFPLGLFIVTVESEIITPLSVVGALKVTLGGNCIVFEELFPAISYTVTVTV